MKRPALLAVGLAALGASTAGMARAETPVVQPTRDVDVTYKVPVAGGAGVSILQRLRFSASLRRQRVDLPTSGNWMVLDFASRRMAMVRDESHEIVDLAAPDSATQPGTVNAFTRVGPGQVAGLDCTEWRTLDTRGQQTIACYTQDGVLLRARNENTVLMEAVGVKFAPQGPDVFKLPDGYSRQTP